MLLRYSQPTICHKDLIEVNKVLTSDFITQGHVGLEFERQLSLGCGAAFCSVFNSATSALHALYHCLGIKQKTKVWCPAVTFVATANAATALGASVHFYDIDPNSANICFEKFEEQLVQATKIGDTPEFVIAVHMGGSPIDLKRLGKLSKAYGFSIIEDASHAWGAEICGETIGSCCHSIAAVFSFHAVKIFTTGEGGCVTTNSSALNDRLREFRSHGINRNVDISDQEPWSYSQTTLGLNYRMPDILAALGMSQLKKSELFSLKREAVRKTYIQGMDFDGMCAQKHEKSVRLSNHLFIVLFDSKDMRLSIYRELKAAGIETTVHYKPLPRLEFYAESIQNSIQFEGADEYYSRCLSLPIHPGMGVAEVNNVLKIIRKKIHGK